MITREKEKMVESEKVKMYDFGQDRAKFLQGFTEKPESARKNTEKQCNPSIIEARQELPADFTHKESVLWAISGFFADNKKQRRTGKAGKGVIAR